jgi:hypothetical protein
MNKLLASAETPTSKLTFESRKDSDDGPWFYVVTESGERNFVGKYYTWEYGTREACVKAAFAEYDRRNPFTSGQVSKILRNEIG